MSLLFFAACGPAPSVDVAEKAVGAMPKLLITELYATDDVPGEGRGPIHYELFNTSDEVLNLSNFRVEVYGDVDAEIEGEVEEGFLAMDEIINAADGQPAQDLLPGQYGVYTSQSMVDANVAYLGEVSDEYTYDMIDAVRILDENHRGFYLNPTVAMQRSFDGNVYAGQLWCTHPNVVGGDGSFGNSLGAPNGACPAVDFQEPTEQSECGPEDLGVKMTGANQEGLHEFFFDVGEPVDLLVSMTNTCTNTIEVRTSCLMPLINVAVRTGEAVNHRGDCEGDEGDQSWSVEPDTDVVVKAHSFEGGFSRPDLFKVTATLDLGGGVTKTVDAELQVGEW